MPYKIRDGLPSSRANTVEFTDFVEFECLRKRDLSISFLEIIKTVDTSDDYQEDDVDELSFTRDSIEEPRVEEALNEVELRFINCNKKYPFIVENNKVVFKSVDRQTNLIYLYLLLCTRLYMGGVAPEKVFRELDGTLLFEELCEAVLLNYWGDRSKSYLFGTAGGNRFKDKVNGLISSIREGGSFNNVEGLTITENDGSLDIAVWKMFSDKRGSQLLGFAQCKTGDTWAGELRKLNPGTFVDTWFTEPTTLTPTNVFMVSDIVRSYFWKTSMNMLFFDRCRIMDFLPNDIDDALVDKLATWVIAALNSYGIDHTKLSIED